MKRILILFMVMVLICLSACKKEDVNVSSEYNFETDCQYYHLSNTQGFHLITESPESYYYVSKECFLHVVDKKTMQDMILCGKPNCLHEKEEKIEDRQKCNAFVGHPSLRNLFYSNGYIYFVEHQYSEKISTEVIPVLVRMSLDGASRKNLLELTCEETKANLPFLYILHRNTLYFVVTQEGTMESSLYRCNLEEKKCEKIYTSSYGMDNLTAIGDYLFFREFFSQDGRTQGRTKYQISTGEYEKIDSAGSIVPIDSQLLIYYCEFDANYTATHSLCLTNFDGSERIPYTIELTGKYKFIYADEKYLYSSELTAPIIEVYDFETKDRVATLSLPESLFSFRNITFSSDGKILVYDNFSDFTIFYCSIHEIGTPDFQWHEVEKVN